MEPDRGGAAVVEPRRDLLHSCSLDGEHDPCALAGRHRNGGGPRQEGRGAAAARHRLPGRLSPCLLGSDRAAADPGKARERHGLGRRHHRRAGGRRGRGRRRLSGGACDGRRQADIDCHQPRLSPRRSTSAGTDRHGLHPAALATGPRWAPSRRGHRGVLDRGQPVSGRDRAEHIYPGRDLRRRVVGRHRPDRACRMAAAQADSDARAA